MKMNVNETIKVFCARVCHDLIGPLGTSQMALEIEDMKSLQGSLNTAIFRLEVLRGIFSLNPKWENNKKNIIKYAQHQELDLQFDSDLEGLEIAIFWLLEKMGSKSKMKIKDDEIELEGVFFNQEEINAFEGKFEKEADARSILPALAFLNYKDFCVCNIQKKGEKNWKIEIQRK